ncbi:MAG: hypothetical protein O7J95_18295 [Planctomycetota bacterium]|nr:hypothetical protein [Planctomycetota bacterium]
MGLRTGDTRKIFHFSIFTCATVLSLTLGIGAVNLLGGLMALYVFTVAREGEGNLLFEGIARESDAPRRGLYVVVPFLSTALGGILSVHCFGSLAAVGFVASGWGDAVAEPVGIRWGRHRYRVPNIGGIPGSSRSWEGTGAVFLASLVGVALVLGPGGLAPDHSLPALLLVAAAVAAASALVEAVSHHGLDNLTVPLAASGVAKLLGA